MGNWLMDAGHLRPSCRLEAAETLEIEIAGETVQARSGREDGMHTRVSRTEDCSEKEHPLGTVPATSGLVLDTFNHW